MAERSFDQSVSPAVRSANRRLGLVLLSVAAVFFAGIVLKRWLMG